MRTYPRKTGVTERGEEEEGEEGDDDDDGNRVDCSSDGRARSSAVDGCLDPSILGATGDGSRMSLRGVRGFSMGARACAVIRPTRVLLRDVANVTKRSESRCVTTVRVFAPIRGVQGMMRQRQVCYQSGTTYPGYELWWLAADDALVKLRRYAEEITFTYLGQVSGHQRWDI